MRKWLFRNHLPKQLNSNNKSSHQLNNNQVVIRISQTQVVETLPMMTKEMTKNQMMMTRVYYE